MNNYDFLVVGAGFTGCVFAERIASQLNKRVLLIDKRSCLGGNCHDFYNSDGILIHEYGPHWFHTNDQRVFNYLSQFTLWRRHEHIVKSFVDGRLVSFPINMNTLNELYDYKFKHASEVKLFYESVRHKNISTPKNAEEAVLMKVGMDLYLKFFKYYTLKQWEIDPSELCASVTGRIPVRDNNDNRYFTDVFQGMPLHGYDELFRQMTKNPKITIELNTEYKKIVNHKQFQKVIYTGAIDHFFDFRYGALPYRSLTFEHETLDCEFFQGYQQVNYPNDYGFTRIIEWKHATGQKHNKTTITREYPCQYNNTNEQLYPVLTSEANNIFVKYQQDSEKLPNIIFAGRLAEYKYFNIDQVVARANHLFIERILKSSQL